MGFAIGPVVVPDNIKETYLDANPWAINHDWDDIWLIINVGKREGSILIFEEIPSYWYGDAHIGNEPMSTTRRGEVSGEIFEITSKKIKGTIDANGKWGDLTWELKNCEFNLPITED